MLYMENIRKYFGTDGIRGIANRELTSALAFKCGNALTSLKQKPKIIIGRDTRKSGDMLSLSVCAGITAGGGSVTDIGIMTSPAAAYVTKAEKADFGIMISASHNPAEFNGIKIFSGDGYKLDDDIEKEIENFFQFENIAATEEIGGYKYSDLSGIYIDSVINNVKCGLKGMKIALDLSNGAAYKLAPEIFKRLGAEVYAVNDDKNGIINDNCGCLYPEKIKEAVKKYNADVGFAYDGDADRLIACEKSGSLMNGDLIVYILANYYKENNLLKNNIAVGTHHTNMAIETKLCENGVKLLRSGIGDRYVVELMKKTGAVIGGEQSGHVIIGDMATTGDGALVSAKLCEIMCKTGKTLSELCDFELFPQENVNVKVSDKHGILNNVILQEHLQSIEKELGSKGRILVRASGTEPKIRIMAECYDERLARKIANGIAEEVNKLANID